MDTIDIYFSDLKEDVQKAILKASNISSPEEANWDVFPIATLDFYNEKEDQQKGWQQ